MRTFSLARVTGVQFSAQKVKDWALKASWKWGISCVSVYEPGQAQQAQRKVDFQLTFETSRRCPMARWTAALCRHRAGQHAVCVVLLVCNDTAWWRHWPCRGLRPSWLASSTRPTGQSVRGASCEFRFTSCTRDVNPAGGPPIFWHVLLCGQRRQDKRPSFSLKFILVGKAEKKNKKIVLLAHYAIVPPEVFC